MQNHLIHIGFPKCASTFLQWWFEAHPEICYKPGALRGIYTIYDLIAETVQPPTHFLCHVTSAEQISMPADPERFSEMDKGYMASKRARLCETLAGSFPDARILMITRNQADVLLSGYSELIRQGGEMTSADVHVLGKANRLHINPFDYDAVLNLYRSHFGDRVLALPFEMLIDDRAAFLGAIADFMGVSHFDIPQSKVNESLDPEQIYWYPRIARQLRRVPFGWLARRLISLHVRMIQRGGYRPVLQVLRLFFGDKKFETGGYEHFIAPFTIDCEELLKFEHYAPYRQLYGDSGENSPERKTGLID